MVSDDQLRILDALRELESAVYRLIKSDGAVSDTKLILGAGVPYALLHVLVGFRTDRFRTDMWELRRSGLVGSKRVASWPYPARFGLFVNEDHSVTVHAKRPSPEDLARYYAWHTGGRFGEAPALLPGDTSDPVGAHRTLIDAESKYRLGRQWHMYAYPDWHAQGCGRFFRIAGPGLAQLRAQREQVESIRAAGLTNGVTYAEIERRARKEAGLIREAQQNADCELADLFAVGCELFEREVEILRGLRGTPSMRPNELVSSFLRLEELLSRARKLGSAKLSLWPRTPATQFAQFSEDSALHVVLRVAEAIVGALGWTRLGANDREKLPDGSAPFPMGHQHSTIIVSEAAPNSAIVAWLDLSIEEIQQRTLPPLDRWAIWEMNRDIDGLASKLRDERSRANV